MKYLILTLLLTSCATVQPPSSPVEKDYPVSGWGTGRDKMALEALEKYGKELVTSSPLDAKEWGLCNTTEGRKHYYVALLSALAKFESNYKSSVTYTEDFDDVKGNKVISRGLLQISQESANSYGCGITKAEQLHTDSENISCGVRIAARWIVKDGVIQGGGSGAWKGMSRYWSPFRKAERIASMKKSVEGVCRE